MAASSSSSSLSSWEAGFMSRRRPATTSRTTRATAPTSSARRVVLTPRCTATVGAPQTASDTTSTSTSTSSSLSVVAVARSLSPSPPPLLSTDVLATPVTLPEEFYLEPGDVSAVLPPDPEDGADAAVGIDPTRTAMGYVRRVLTSKVYDVAIESPLEHAPRISDRSGCQVYLKREDLQSVFSFKLRGAYNKMANLTPAQLASGVICSSAGNHAQGVALAARELGCSAVIAMPITTPMIKVKAVERLGATVVLVGEAYDETQAYAKARALEDGRVFIPPFDDPDVIAGQGTVGMEILRQHPGDLHAIFVPVGGGGLIAGIAAYVKEIRPEIKVIGVEPVEANAMAQSLALGHRIRLARVGGFADGVAVKMVGEETFRMCRSLVDGVVLVGNDAICAAIKDVFEEKRSILEPAGALALAGAKAYIKKHNLSGGNVVAVTSGANMNFDRLRLVSELADVGERKEAVLATTIAETPGAFKDFVGLLGNVSITEFKYRYSHDSKAFIMYRGPLRSAVRAQFAGWPSFGSCRSPAVATASLPPHATALIATAAPSVGTRSDVCSVGVPSEDELAALKHRLAQAGLETLDMSDNDLAKIHLRHLVGRNSTMANESLWRFEFPERPGALHQFLEAFSPRWNISLFHYRNQGEGTGNVLVGLQVPVDEEDAFHGAAQRLGYEYVDENNNEALKMFLR
eukprot:jgi/Chlat1/8300/Chrsp78S07715